MLHAGRLTTEEGPHHLIEACAGLPDAHLSVAAPIPPDRAADNIRYLGWLPRRALWREFAHHDVLAVRFTTLEAFGLVAVEAQAAGLPVLHKDVPGLAETLNDTALPVDFTSTHLPNLDRPDQWVTSQQVVHPVIVDDDTFTQAQAILKARAHKNKGSIRTHATTRPYALRGMIH